MATKLNSFTINFKVNTKEISFTIYTDLDNIEIAVQSWVYRTKTFTAESLCNYIKSKEPHITCLTEKQWKQ